VNAAGEGSESRWPAGIGCMAAVTVNFDAETLLLSEDPTFRDRQKSLSIMRYGAHRGAQRLLEIFAEKDVLATWFLPGRVAETYPGVVREDPMVLEKLDALSLRTRLREIGKK